MDSNNGGGGYGGRGGAGRGGGWRGGRRGHGGWRGNYYRRGNKGRGRGTNSNSSGEENNHNYANRGRGSYGGYPRPVVSSGEDSPGQERSGGAEPPGKRQKRADPLQSIKDSVEKQWREQFPGYDFYYSDGPPQLSDVSTKINAIEDYIRRRDVVEVVLGRGEEKQDYVSISYEDLIVDKSFCNEWMSFNADLVDDPEQTLALWGATAHKFLACRSLIMKMVHNATLEQEQSSEDSRNSSGGPPLHPKIHVGFLKFEPVTSLTEIKSNLLGKLVTVRGAIVRAGNTHPRCSRMTFRCKVCDKEFAVVQPEGKYTPPTQCYDSRECRNGSAFEPLEDASTTIMIDSRRIRLQDVHHYDLERGSVPRTVDCELIGSMANQCCTGDTVTFTGIVKMSRDVQYGREQSLHNMYIEVSGFKQHKECERTMGGHIFSFTNKDYYAIKEIHETSDLFRLLIASLCPSIYGHELVKAGLLLCLFGGTARVDQMISRRSDINMIMVGDPGIGKSQMLKAISEVAPRAVYICGTGSTVAGLTVTLVKDGDDYSLEAGALVMADRGVCCIDEFDKMSSQHAALLEALEQQSVSIAKSGVYRTLPARASVICAANPVGGHYDNRKTVSENIKISSPLLSRFDLVFILLDKADSEFDQRLVNHVAGIKFQGFPSASNNNATLSNNPADASQIPLRLMDKIRIPRDAVLDLIPHVLLRKYIAYAKQYVRPKISPEAAAVLKKYYLNLRSSYRNSESAPVTTRQLESLVRLTEARAKMELREDATAEDANDILEIFEFSLSSAYDVEAAAVSALSESILIHTGSKGRSQSIVSQAKKLVSALQNCAQRQAKNIFSIDEIKAVAAGLGFQQNVNGLIAALNNEGFLIKKAANTYKLQTADY